MENPYEKVIKELNKDNIKFCSRCFETQNLIEKERQIFCYDCLYIYKIINKKKNIN
jgi:DNA-directed RNA polymerase subunit RPC12/RpoP